MLSAAFFSSPVAAHKMIYSPPGRQGDTTTVVGVIKFQIWNQFDETTRFQIEVFDEEKQAIPDDHWRTDVEGDVIELGPGEDRIWRLQVRYPGRYLACTRRIGSTLTTRICANLNRPF